MTVLGTRLTPMNCPNCGKSLWFVRMACPFCQAQIKAPARPKSVTVTCVIILVLCGLGFLASLGNQAMVPDRTHHPIRFALFYGGIGVAFLSGTFAFLGHNWARWLLIVWLAYNVAVGILVQASLMFILLRAFVLAATGYYLFRPQAKLFFSGSAPPGPGA